MPPPPPPPPPLPGSGNIIAKGPNHEEMMRQKAQAEEDKRQAQEAEEERLKNEAKAKREKEHGHMVPHYQNDALMNSPKFLRLAAMAKEFEHNPNNIEHVHGHPDDPPTLNADPRRGRSAAPRSKAGPRAGSRSSIRSNSAARNQRAAEAEKGNMCKEAEWNDP